MTVDENGLMIHYTRQIGFRRLGWTTGARVAQVFFESPPSDNLPDCDLLICVQVPQPPEGHYVWPFSTLVLDLEPPEAKILAAIKPEVRRQIRQLDKNGTHSPEITADPSPSLVDAFCAFYAEFAHSKGVDDLHPEEVRAIARARRLVLACARDHEGKALVWHAYYRSERRAVQLCSASHFRSLADRSERALIGKANRWLLWRSLLFFRGTGIALFDFGGWYLGATNHELLRVNAFKEEFAGRLLHEWNSRLGCSPKGKALVAIKRWRDRLTKI